MNPLPASSGVYNLMNVFGQINSTVVVPPSVQQPQVNIMSVRPQNMQIGMNIQGSSQPQSSSQQQMRPLMICQKQRNSIKNSMHIAVKDGNMEQVVNLLREFDFDPNEEVSVAGYGWTALHYACHFRQPAILELFINVIYSKHSLNLFSEVMNIKTKEGWTPLMLACLYNSPECTTMLITYGGIDLTCIDHRGVSAAQLAQRSQLPAAIAAMSAALLKNPSGVIPPNTTYFEAKKGILQGTTPSQNHQQKKKKEMDKETQVKYKKLLEEGYRLPCVICQVELGYIKYTDCCGQPMHGHCQTEKITSCPVCRNSAYTLTTDVIYPERAFSLEQQ